MLRMFKRQIYSMGVLMTCLGGSLILVEFAIAAPYGLELTIFDIHILPIAILATIVGTILVLKFK